MKKNVIDKPGELGQMIEMKKLERKVLSFDENARYRQTTITDKNGEIVSDTVRRVVRQNGSGFVISYTEKMLDFLKKTSTSAVIRVFLYLAHKQHFGDDGIFGCRCSKKFLCETLGLTRKSVYDAIKHLIDNFLIVENRIDGQLEFMVNPDYVTIGTNKQARMREWSQRWRWYFDNQVRKKK